MADLPPRKSGKYKGVDPPPQQQGTNEWICAYCEFELLYGGEEEYRQAIRRRKKILKRRRRARERAARGVAGRRVDRPEQDNEPGSEDDADFFPDVPAAGQRTTVGVKAEAAGRETGYG